MKNLLQLICFLAFFGVLVSCNPSKEKPIDGAEHEIIEAFLINARDSSLPVEIRKNYVLRAMEQIEQVDNDSLKAVGFSRIARWAIQFPDSILFLEANFKSEKIATKIKSPYLLGDIKWNLAEFYLDRHVYDLAFISYQEAHVFFEEVPHPYYVGKMLYNMAYIKSLITDYTGAEIMLFQALEIFERLEKRRQIFQVFNLLGSIYDDLREYNRALEHYEKALKYFPNTKEGGIKREDLQNNIGLVYQKMGNHPQAIKTFDMALENRMIYERKPLLYARLLDNRAFSVLRLEGADINLLEDFEKALKIRDSLTDKPGVIMSHLRLASYFLAQQEVDRAKHHAEIAYDLSFKKQLYRDKLESLKLLSEIDTLRSKKYLNRYIDLSNELISKQSQTRDKFARIHFETDKYIKKNERLDRAKTWLTITIIGVLMLFILVYVIMNQRSRNKKLVFEALQQKSNEEIYLLRLQQMNESEKARKEERERISEELHDSIVAQLFGIRLRWDFAEVWNSEERLQLHKQQLEELQNVENGIRKISHNLNNHSIKDSANFLVNIRKLIEEKSQLGGFQFHFEHYDAAMWESLDVFTKVNLHRILEEALHNIVKHAGASKVSLILMESEGKPSLELRDNGKGYEETLGRKGIGIKNMRSRAHKIGSSITIKKTGNGTLLLMKFKK